MMIQKNIKQIVILNNLLNQQEKITKFIEQNNITYNICSICFCEIEKDDSISLKCNHNFCKECYVEYINNKLLTEPMNILNTPCPLNGCNLYLTRTIYRKCITEKKMQKIFAKGVVFNFIKTNKNIKVCPNPGCKYSIKVQENSPKEIKCKCGHIFCFSCLEESHIPCNCVVRKLWILLGEELYKKYGQKIDIDEKKNLKHLDAFAWIYDNTKQCPNCDTPIEKNQGCNHMTCKKEAGGCGYEFCWNCLCDWDNHQYCYNKGSKKEKQIKGNKQLVNQLERFIIYFKEWKTQQKISEFIENLKDKVDDYKEELSEKNILDEDLIFLDEALDLIINTNRYLKYIFIFGYYLKGDANITLFEYNYQLNQINYKILLNVLIEHYFKNSFLNIGIIPCH